MIKEEKFFLNISPRRLGALIKKESFQIIKDPSTLLISVALPLILLFLYGFGVSLDLDHLKIGLVLEDTSPEAISFSKSLIDSPYFDVKLSRDRRDFLNLMEEGTIRGLVIIPAYFTTFRNLKGTTAPIQVITDGSEPNTASFVQNYVTAAWQNWLTQEMLTTSSKKPAVINIQPRFWYNEELESRNFLIPGSLAIIMTLIGTLLTSLVISREWERGSMEALMATPVTILEILLGKIIPYFILGMGSMILCVVVATYFYGVPFRGSWIVLLTVSGCFLTTALGIGLFISTLTRSQFVAAQAAMTTAFLPAYMLSGFIFEISSMPLYIQVVTYFIPARYFVSSLQTLFLVGDVPSLILKNSLIMLGFGLLLFILIKKRYIKRLDT